ncbi:MAG: hypothetical protein Q4P20_11140 [Eubacteriales bacterium]|nr:hypothetical protein [Eubacteriales bacterium]
MKKRLLSLLIAMCMMITMIPMAFAANTTMDETTFRNAVAAGGTVTLTGNVTLTSPLTISNAVTIDGTSAKYAISYTGGESEYTITTTVPNVVLKNLTINRNSAQNGVNASNSGLEIVDCDINAYRRGVNFYISGNNDNATLDISGTKIVNTKADDTYGVYYSTDNRGVATGNIKNGMITIEDSQILGFKYSINPVIDPVNSLRDGNGTMFDVSNTVIKGWTALNIWSANTDFYFTDCTLIGVNGLSGDSNNYSVITANHGIYGNVANTGSAVTFEGGSLVAVKYGGSDQTVFNVDNEYKTEFAFENGTDNKPVSIKCYRSDNTEMLRVAHVWNFYYFDAIVNPEAAAAKADQYMKDKVTGYSDDYVAAGTISEYENMFAGVTGYAEADTDAEFELAFEQNHVGGDVQ